METICIPFKAALARLHRGNGTPTRDEQTGSRAHHERLGRPSRIKILPPFIFQVLIHRAAIGGLTAVDPARFAF